MKIALFGGSFNPPHLGHLAVVKDLLESKSFDEIWIIPSFKHPFEKNLIPFEDRIQMCHLTFDSLGKKIKISKIEKEVNSSQGYTIDLINTLLKKYPKNHFTLLLGSDLLQETDRWKNFDEIKKKVSVSTIPRAGYETSNYPNISSSEVRKAIETGEKIETLVPKPVFDYIEQKGFYR